MRSLLAVPFCNGLTVKSIFNECSLQVCKKRGGGRHDTGLGVTK